MSLSICLRCEKEFKFPYLLKRHNERKFPCKAVVKKTENEDPSRITKNHQESLRITKNHQESLPLELYKNKHPCEYCNKNISKRLLNRHQRDTCLKIPKTIKNNLIEKYNKNKKHKKSLELSNKVSNNNSVYNYKSHNNNTNTINSNNTTNNNITIKINPFGEENMDHLNKNDILKIINRCYMAIPDLIKKIHNRPENRNFYIPNFNKTTIAYLNRKNEIVYNDYKEICHRMINKNIRRLDDYFNDFEKDLQNNIKTRMIKVLEENYYENHNEKYMKDIKYYLMNISRKNKKELNDFIDKLEAEIKNK